MEQLDSQAVDRLLGLRQRLFDALRRELKLSDGHCKSYEGQFGIIFPNYFERDGGGDFASDGRWTVTLDCYLIGPHRHYTWSGRTLARAVAKADREVSRWLEQIDDR